MITILLNKKIRVRLSVAKPILVSICLRQAQADSHWTSKIAEIDRNSRGDFATRFAWAIRYTPRPTAHSTPLRGAA
ncbi:MAG: hypothetical protein ACK5UP_10495, partial [Bacteroidota bacterium]